MWFGYVLFTQKGVGWLGREEFYTAMQLVAAAKKGQMPRAPRAKVRICITLNLARPMSCVQGYFEIINLHCRLSNDTQSLY